jgi:hypothetical protein
MKKNLLSLLIALASHSIYAQTPINLTAQTNTADKSILIDKKIK